MTFKADILKEREGLAARVAALELLLLAEWQTMSWGVATERGKELIEAKARIQAIDRTRAGRERRRRASK